MFYHYKALTKNGYHRNFCTILLDLYFQKIVYPILLNKLFFIFKALKILLDIMNHRFRNITSISALSKF